MTSARLLMLVRELSPNTFSDSMIMMWISEIEYALATDINEVDPSRLVELTEPTQAPMLIPHPFDRVYLPYVQAMVANAQGETDLYQNYIAKYNAYRDEWAQWVLNWRCRRNAYYIDAYQLAREHGYEGTIEQWLESLKGDKGDKGDGVLIKGHYDTLEQLRQEHPVGYLGDYYEVGTETDNALVYYWDAVAGEWHGIDIVDGQRKSREYAEMADRNRAISQQAASSAETNAASASADAREAMGAADAARESENGARSAADRAEAAAAGGGYINLTAAWLEQGRGMSPAEFLIEYAMEYTDGRALIRNGQETVTTAEFREAGSCIYTTITTYYDESEIGVDMYVNRKQMLWGNVSLDEDRQIRFVPAEIENNIDELKHDVRILKTATEGRLYAGVIDNRALAEKDIPEKSLRFATIKSLQEDVQAIRIRGKNRLNLEADAWTLNGRAYNELKLNLPIGRYTLSMQRNRMNSGGVKETPYEGMGTFVACINIQDMTSGWTGGENVTLIGRTTSAGATRTKFELNVTMENQYSLYFYFGQDGSQGLPAEYMNMLKEFFGGMQLESGDATEYAEFRQRQEFIYHGRIKAGGLDLEVEPKGTIILSDGGTPSSTIEFYTRVGD